MSIDDVEHEFDRLRMAHPNPSVHQNPHRTTTDASSPPNSTDTSADAPDTSDSDLHDQRDPAISAADAHSLKLEGNTHYQASDYSLAVEAYTRAASSAHASDDDRAVYLANRAAAHLKLSNHSEVVADASHALRLKPRYLKALARRKEAYEHLEDWRAALQDAKELDCPPHELRRLTTRAEQREQKDRDEAMSALKGLGNSLLSNFGMSLDNFAVERDPTSGSYSVKMK